MQLKPQPDHDNDNALILAIKNKDAKALNKVYEKYGAAVYGIILKQADNCNAEKLLEKVFTTFYKNCIDPNVIEKGSLLISLIKIAHRACVEEKAIKQPASSKVYNNAHFTATTLQASSR